MTSHWASITIHVFPALHQFRAAHRSPLHSLSSAGSIVADCSHWNSPNLSKPGCCRRVVLNCSSMLDHALASHSHSDRIENQRACLQYREYTDHFCVSLETEQQQELALRDTRQLVPDLKIPPPSLVLNTFPLPIHIQIYTCGTTTTFPGVRSTSFSGWLHSSWPSSCTSRSGRLPQLDNSATQASKIGEYPCENSLAAPLRLATSCERAASPTMIITSIPKPPKLAYACIIHFKIERSY